MMPPSPNKGDLLESVAPQLERLLGASRKSQRTVAWAADLALAALDDEGTAHHPRPQLIARYVTLLARAASSPNADPGLSIIALGHIDAALMLAPQFPGLLTPAQLEEVNEARVELTDIVTPYGDEIAPESFTEFQASSNP